MNEPWHVGMSHSTYGWVMAQMNEWRHTVARALTPPCIPSHTPPSIPTVNEQGIWYMFLWYMFLWYMFGTHTQYIFFWISWSRFIISFSYFIFVSFLTISYFPHPILLSFPHSTILSFNHCVLSTHTINRWKRFSKISLRSKRCSQVVILSMSHGTHMNETCTTYPGGMSYVGMNGAWHTYHCVMTHVSMSHGAHRNDACHTRHTCQWVMQHTYMRLCTHIEESWHTHQLAIRVAHISTGHGTHMNASWHTYERCIQLYL